jgi:hypothetical protein
MGTSARATLVDCNLREAVIGRATSTQVASCDRIVQESVLTPGTADGRGSMVFYHPSWNTDQGVYLMGEPSGDRNRTRCNESDNNYADEDRVIGGEATSFRSRDWQSGTVRIET